MATGGDGPSASVLWIPRSRPSAAPEWLAQRDRGIAQLLRNVASVIDVPSGEDDPALPEIQILKSASACGARQT